MKDHKQGSEAIGCSIMVLIGFLITAILNAVIRQSSIKMGNYIATGIVRVFIVYMILSIVYTFFLKD
jgi:hypothetical protein